MSIRCTSPLNDRKSRADSGAGGWAYISLLPYRRPLIVSGNPLLSDGHITETGAYHELVRARC